MSQIPRLFLEQMQERLGEEYPAFAQIYDQPPSAGLRVNTLKLDPEAFVRLSPIKLQPIPWTKAGYSLLSNPPDSGPSPGKHPYHAAGLYYLQDPSAMAVAELLSPQPGERVLDLSAAPGGKSTHLASLMKNLGLLVANEISPKRVRALMSNLERWGARNVVIANETPARMANHLDSFFDKVLVDAPCSGEGMFRKETEACTDWSPQMVASCAARQGLILREAARLVRPGGKLIYATCTFSPEEDEGSLVNFLVEHPDFSLVEATQHTGFLPGRPEWLEENNPGRTSPLHLDRAVRLWPHRAPGEGHFIGILQRAEGKDQANFATWQPNRLPPSIEHLYREFCRDSLKISPTSNRLCLVGSNLYAIPPEMPDPGKLRWMHPGWWLGTIKYGSTGRLERFEPSHALALSLQPRDALQTLDLTCTDRNLAAYLRGETIEHGGTNGWVLISVDGFSLGWGKRVQGRVKNFYPRGLRWFY